MSKNKKPLQVRLGDSSQRVREWAELTGRSENKIAELFAQAGIMLVENANAAPAERLQLWAKGFASQLKAASEAEKLRKQAQALQRRAAQLVRDSKPQ